MMTDNDKLILAMISYDSGMVKQIQHFLKVYEFAALIGRMENLPPEDQHILETAAIVHDIGIKSSLEKYDSSAGNYQEIEGPALVREMLSALGYSEDVIGRVCYLVGHHHTYKNIDGLDYQILVEADFLVNLYEDGCSLHAVQSTYNKIFKTESGRKIIKEMFNF